MTIKNLSFQPLGSAFRLTMDVSTSDKTDISFTTIIENKTTDSIVELQKIALETVGNELLKYAQLIRK
jgi:hypothetical protein